MPASSKAFHVASGRRRNRVASLDASRKADDSPMAFSTIDLLEEPLSLARAAPLTSVSLRSIGYPPTTARLGWIRRATLRKLKCNFDDHVLLTTDGFAAAD